IQYSILPFLLFLALSLLAVRVFLALFAPKPYEAPLVPFSDYDRAGMLEAVSPDRVRESLDEVAALGDRFAGKPGFYAAEELIRQRYTAAGLALHEQEIYTVAPQTEFAEALGTDGQPVGFRIYPFMPNYYQPVATPDAGVTATLLEVNDEVLKTGASFKGCFALIDGAAPAPIGYGYDYTKYAQLGFEGVVVSHREGLDAMRWDQTRAMCSVNPVNYLRVAAEPGVFEHVGRSVTLRARVRYQEVPNRTLIGVLKGDSPNREALVIPCSYDALSILPDRSPGIIQAGQVATHLQLLDGLVPHRGALRRDVVFVAFGGRFMAHEPQDRLVSAIGAQVDRQGRRNAFEAERARHDQQLGWIAASAPVLVALDGPDAAARTAEALAGLEGDAEAFFTDQLQYVLNTLVFERSETVLTAKIAFEKGDATDLASSAFDAYQAARKVYDKAFSCAGLRLDRLLKDQPEFVADEALARRLAARFEALRLHHEARRGNVEQSLALNALFADYSQVVVMAPELIPCEEQATGAEAITFTMGRSVDHGRGGQPARQALQAAIQELGLESKLSLRYTGSRSYGDIVSSALSGQGTESEYWAKAGYPAYSVVSHGRSYREFAYPSELAWMRNMVSLEASLRTFGATVLSVAYGNGAFKPLTFNPGYVFSAKGNVYVANVGQSIIPNYPLAGALVGCAPSWFSRPDSGYSGQVLLLSDLHGRYEREYALAPFGMGYDYSPDAVAFDDSGAIYLVKDQGPKAQRIYTSMHLGPESRDNDVNIVCYRAAPVTLLDLINPQSMRSYAGARFVRTRGLNDFDSTFRMPDAEGVLTGFIKPDEYFYIELKAG
ncbi:MAG: hypothetical protein HQ559_15695, partial [Lentisphaerae bacterium]|nr:hypothetical protein [Lentisphaerota bacterium]